MANHRFDDENAVRNAELLWGKRDANKVLVALERMHHSYRQSRGKGRLPQPKVYVHAVFSGVLGADYDYLQHVLETKPEEAQILRGISGIVLSYYDMFKNQVRCAERIVQWDKDYPHVDKAGQLLLSMRWPKY